MILVDTSIWIATFRKTRPLDLETLVSLDDVVTCLPIVQEVLQGFRDESAYRRARVGMLSLPTLESPLRQEVFLQAADLYRSARHAGITVRASADCLIATCALRNDMEVLHLDRDFDLLAKICPLRVRSP